MSHPDGQAVQPPAFSVIIPTYNRAHVLPRAIGSVLGQSCGNLELLIVDDGSSDGTDRCVAGFRDARIRYIRHEQNHGQNTALNTGLREARGTFVSFLDSDDEWDQDMLEAVRARFASDPDLGWVYTAYRVKEASGRVSTPAGGGLDGWVYAEALEQGHVAPPTVFSVRRSCFDVTGGFDLDVVVGQDDVMCLKLARSFKVGHVNAVLATMHWDSGARLSDDLLRTAVGYYRVYETFSADIVAQCGRATLARRYAHAGMLFLNAGKGRMAFVAYFKSLTQGRSAAAIPGMCFSLLPPRWREGIRAMRLAR